MNEEQLAQTAKSMVAPGKGLLAADESNNSCQKRFDAVGVPCTPETRAEYRGLLFSTPGAETFLNGVILFDETFWQTGSDGQPFRDMLGNKGIAPGIKVDKGLIDLPGFPNEKLTQGLDGLPEQMQKYAESGARFAKWRSVITIGDDIPSNECIEANAYVLARYARICQDAGVVPIVEPEVLYDGTHSIERCEAVTKQVYTTLFAAMRFFRVYLPGAILKTGMVLPGKDSGVALDYDDVAARTAGVLQSHVPHELGGVVFLSGGQTPTDALINLNRIAQRGPYPWGLTFSYSRALQDPVLKAWAANRQDVAGAQKLFYQQLVWAGAASKGELREDELSSDTFVSHSQDL